MGISIGHRNIRFGWLWILAGIILGAILGMWSFNGPLPSPIGAYDALPRRMIRLSHIAFIALSIINILYGYEIDSLRIGEKAKKSGSLLLILGSVLMPTFLIISAFFEPFKYILMIPAMLILASLVIMAFGKFRD
jgi:hypothetical protein